MGGIYQDIGVFFTTDWLDKFHYTLLTTEIDTVIKQHPSRHAMLSQRRIDVDATS